MELMNARGTRDFAPEEAIKRQQIADMLKKTFELYGFSPLETPIIERYDVLSAKYAGGAEILKETFKFKDQGERDLCLRYDLTVPLARFIGMNPTVKMPFKRYVIGDVFRDGPIKTGRYREFVQCDCDIIGSKSMLADAQCIQLGQKVFENLELDVNFEVNDRKLLDGMLEFCGIPQDKWVEAILEMDKLKKTGAASVKKELSNKGIENSAIEKLMKLLDTKGSNDEKISKLKKQLATNARCQEGLAEIEELLSYVDQKNVVFNISLSRGLSYYTGPVFEAFLKDEKLFGSSLSGGGRWDRMIGEFLQSKKEYPAVGISFGMEPITEVMKMLKKEKTAVKTTAQLFIIPINTMKESIKIAEEFRAAGINTDIDIVGRGVSKNLDYVNAQGIPYSAFVGEDELKEKKIKLKDMMLGGEKIVSVKDACKLILKN